MRAGVPPDGEWGHEKGGDDDARSNQHRGRSRGGGVFVIGGGYQGGHGGGIAGGGCRGDAGSPIASGQAVDEDEEGSGDEDDCDSEGYAEQSGLPDALEVKGGAEG